MRIIVTGGTGFIGSNLIKYLKTKDYEIISLTRRNSYEQNGIKFINVDYHNLDDLKKKLKCDILIHLAATLFARTKKEFIYENVNSTRNLVDAARENRVKKIIYLSSLAAGGPSQDITKPRNEKTPDNPVSYYGLSKLLGELEIKRFERWTILRPPIVYGPKDDGFSTIAQWVKKGIMISPQKKDAMFSFIFVDDLVKCIIRSIEEDLDNEVFYVCEKKYYTWNKFITLMAETMNIPRPKMITMPKTFLQFTAFSYEIFSYLLKTKPVLNRDKIREATTSHWIADPSKWEEKTNLKNWTTIEEGFKKTFSPISSLS